jgi:hypothetical protein
MDEENEKDIHHLPKASNQLKCTHHTQGVRRRLLYRHAHLSKRARQPIRHTFPVAFRPVHKSHPGRAHGICSDALRPLEGVCMRTRTAVAVQQREDAHSKKHREILFNEGDLAQKHSSIGHETQACYLLVRKSQRIFPCILLTFVCFSAATGVILYLKLLCKELYFCQNLWFNQE